jgi:hypothetical protein
VKFAGSAAACGRQQRDILIIGTLAVSPRRNDNPHLAIEGSRRLSTTLLEKTMRLFSTGRRRLRDSLCSQTENRDALVPCESKLDHLLRMSARVQVEFMIHFPNPRHAKNFSSPFGRPMP